MSDEYVCPKCKATENDICRLGGKCPRAQHYLAALHRRVEPFPANYAVPAYLPSELTITSPPLTLETQAALTLALASTTDAITREWILATLQRGISG